MLAVVAPMLAGGVKEFFENPAYLLGLPLLILGALGALAALSPIEIRSPWAQQTGTAETPAEVTMEAGIEGHPGPAEYVRVGTALAIITVAEVSIYYANLAHGALLGLLLSLSLTKFLLVALWFMHLRFDSRLFSTLFAGGLALVVALFFVVLATLGANLV